jgi:tetratricopeptide (TPR) repeat protein
LEEVVGSLDHLTDRERYGILAFYAVNVENDLNKGIEYTKSRIDLYPDDFAARNNLGWYYWQTSMFTRAVAEYKSAIQINPYAMLTYGGLIRMQLENLANLDSAFVWSEKMIRYNPDNAWGYFYLGSTYVGYDSLQQAEITYKKSVALDPKLMLSQYRLAHVYRLLDQYHKSNEVLQNILDINSEEIPAYYILGINYRKMEKEEQAKASFKTYLQKIETWMEQYPDYPGTYTSIGAVWTQLGEIEKGWEIGEKAIQKDSTFHFDFAAFLSIQGKKQEALNHLEEALKNGYRDIVWIKLIPDLDAIREEPRFRNLMAEYFG